MFGSMTQWADICKPTPIIVWVNGLSKTLNSFLRGSVLVLCNLGLGPYSCSTRSIN